MSSYILRVFVTILYYIILVLSYWRRIVPNPAGCEFTSSQGHVKSFADQSFQSMKSKEVRDAGSPPKEFTYRGQGAPTNLHRHNSNKTNAY